MAEVRCGFVRRLRGTGTVAVALASAVALAACGSSSSSSSTSGGSSTGSSSAGGSFASAADAICSQEAAAEIAATRGPTSSKQASVAQVNALIASRNASLAKLRALSPPRQDRAAYSAFLSEWPAVEAVWRQNITPITKGAAAYDAGGAAGPAFDAAQAEAAKAGLTTCAGKLRTSDASALASFIRASQLKPTPSLCTRHTTPRFLAVAGGMSACLQSANTHSTQVQISDLHGTAPIAYALVTRSGGNQAAGKLNFWMVYLNGRWQLDDAY